MHIKKNILLAGANDKPIVLDIFFEKEMEQLPVIIYTHGFCGFKDWGNFDLIAKKFAEKGCLFVKFNFSHNGTTPELPEEFADLEAFGLNNYSKELADLRIVTDWVCDPLNPYRDKIDTSRVSLLGHSLGGGIVILYAAGDSRVRKLVTWASVNECNTPWGNWPIRKMQEWKIAGVQYYINGRTHQEMPLYYQLYEDFKQNQSRLDIKEAISKLNIPILLCHGTLDDAVPVTKAFKLKEWQPAAQLFTVESDHVFGRKHPWLANELPLATEAVVTKSLGFLFTDN